MKFLIRECLRGQQTDNAHTHTHDDDVLMYIYGRRLRVCRRAFMHVYIFIRIALMEIFLIYMHERGTEIQRVRLLHFAAFLHECGHICARERKSGDMGGLSPAKILSTASWHQFHQNGVRKIN